MEPETSQPGETALRPPAAAQPVLPWLVGVSFFMESLDHGILNTSAPVVARALGAPPLELKSALTAYTLAVALFIPLAAWLTDRFGTRRVFAGAMAVFSAGSLCCGLATGLPALVAARALQGIGGAMLMPVGRVALVRTFRKDQMIRAMSFVVIPGMLGPLLGPPVGGLLAEDVHWRAIFLVNLPVGLLGAWAASRHMPDFRSDGPGPLDLRGFVLFGAGVASASRALGLLAERGAGPGAALPWGLASSALLGGYALHARRRSRPLLDLEVFRERTFRVSVSGGFLSRLGIGGMPFLLPLFFQVGLGLRPLAAALLMVPQPLAAISTKLLHAPVLARAGYRRILRVNTLAVAGCIAAFAAVGPATPRWAVAALAFLYGTCTSLQFTSVNSLQYADLAPEQASMGSCISSVAQQLSLGFGVALASLLTALLLGDGPVADAGTLRPALRGAFLALGGVTALSSLVFRDLRAGDGVAVSRPRAAPARARMAA